MLSLKSTLNSTPGISPLSTSYFANVFSYFCNVDFSHRFMLSESQSNLDMPTSSLSISPFLPPFSIK